LRLEHYKAQIVVLPNQYDAEDISIMQLAKCRTGQGKKQKDCKKHEAIWSKKTTFCKLQCKIWNLI